MVTLNDITHGRVLELQSVEILEDAFGVILKLRVLLDINGTQVCLNFNLKTDVGEVNRIFSLTKSKLTQVG